jgi:hypothetical protein
MANPSNYRFFKGEYNGAETSRVNADGSAEFSGKVTANAFIGATWTRAGFSGISVSSHDVNGSPSQCIIPTNSSGGGADNLVALGADTYRFKALRVVTTRSSEVIIETEADDDTKYTTTTDSEGNETRVYNGAVLDVKETLQAALTTIADLQARIAVLEAA